jgi:hypothetical protein
MSLATQFFKLTYGTNKSHMSQSHGTHSHDESLINDMNPTSFFQIGEFHLSTW